MHTFGNKSEFEIKYQTLSEKYVNDPDVLKELKGYECWGEISFNVKNIDLFEIKNIKTNSNQIYIGGIFQIIYFLCKNLYYHLIDDPFPANINANTAIDVKI